MATQEAAIKAVLTGDNTFNTAASGGVFISPDDFDTNEGATPDNLDNEGAYAAAGGLNPIAVLHFGAESASNIQLGALRFFRLFLSQEKGYTNIRALKRRAIILLDRTTITSDNETASYIEYADSREYIDDSLQNASTIEMRFFILYARSPS